MDAKVPSSSGLLRRTVVDSRGRGNPSENGRSSAASLRTPGHLQGTCGCKPPGNDERARTESLGQRPFLAVSPGHPDLWGSSSATGDHGADADRALCCPRCGAAAQCSNRPASTDPRSMPLTVGNSVIGLSDVRRSRTQSGALDPIPKGRASGYSRFI